MATNITLAHQYGNRWSNAVDVRIVKVMSLRDSTTSRSTIIEKSLVGDLKIEGTAMLYLLKDFTIRSINISLHP